MAISAEELLWLEARILRKPKFFDYPAGSGKTDYEITSMLLSAVRELRAIKGAEPVGYAWEGYLDRSYCEFPCIQEQEPNTVALIRKPE